MKHARNRNFREMSRRDFTRMRKANQIARQIVRVIRTRPNVLDVLRADNARLAAANN